MAVTQAGSTLTFNITTANSGTVSSTITVPLDAQIAVVGVSGYSGGTANFFSSGGMTLTKSGVDTAVTSATLTGDASTGLWMAAAFYLALPDTGANKTLKWDWAGAGAASNAPLISVTFWKGIDTASPVRDSDGVQAATIAGGIAPTPTLTAQTGDLIVAFLGAFGSAAEGSVNSWSNLTLLANLAQFGSCDGAWATGSPSGNTTVGASSSTSLDDGGLIAIVLKPAVTTTDGVGSSAATGAATATGTPISSLIPDADITDGSWLTDTGGTSLFAAIDESPASDADYIVSGSPDTDMCEIRLSDPGMTVARPFSVAYRYKRIGTDTPTLRVQLMEGATSRASWDVAVSNSTFTDGEQFLTAPEFASIVDFTDLRVRFTAIRESSLTLEGDFSGSMTLEGDFSGSLLLEGS